MTLVTGFCIGADSLWGRNDTSGHYNRGMDTPRIVLVGTQHPGNIGSAARAMKTMGLSQLALVAPEKFPDPQAFALAAGAADLLESATLHASLEEAVADCRTVIATTARQRSVPMPELSPREGAARARAAQALGPVALVFGRERTGLENSELQLCHAAIHIPANPEYSSLNLAAAVQIVAYEWRLADPAPAAPSTPSSDEEPPATHAELEGFFTHLFQLLDEVDFHKGKDPAVVTQRLRRLYLRAGPDARELRILRGLISDTQRLLRAKSP
jgi:tRNA (cytidine32/uridine32-2'-O)-methyltransferase